MNGSREQYRDVFICGVSYVFSKKLRTRRPFGETSFFSWQYFLILINTEHTEHAEQTEHAEHLDMFTALELYIQQTA